MTLNAQMANIDLQVTTAREIVNDIEHQLSSAGPMKPDERARLSGQLVEAKHTLSSLLAQAEIVRSKLADLEVHSPIDGQIVTPDVKIRLEGRPVQKGQSLLRVADPEGDWELDLHVSEDQVGHIARAKRLADERKEQLTVSYILATEPETTLKGTVKEITSAGILENDEANVLIKVAINKQDIDPANFREGTVVTGKVLCGGHSLGYVWFHDLIGFISGARIPAHRLPRPSPKRA